MPCDRRGVLYDFYLSFYIVSYVLQSVSINKYIKRVALSFSQCLVKYLY